MKKPARFSIRVVWTTLVVLMFGQEQGLHAQEQAVSAAPPQTVTALKVESQQFLRSGGIYQGLTAVDLEPGLDSIIRGQEPRSIEELIALERQQVKVASKIATVTVNIQQGSAQGSGVVVTPEGIILTAAHVAGRPNRDAKITFSDGRVVQGRTLGMNRSVDAGLVKIISASEKEWPHASLGEVSDTRLGQWVIAAGHPGGYDEARPPVIRIGRLLDSIPTTLITDCALIGGDSGGPLFDLSGRLIGIHSRIGSEVADNMHVPVSMYRSGWERMVKGESWGTLPGHKPVIGVRGFAKGPQASQATVENVIEGGPADRAGILHGDIITRFDGVEVKTFEDLIAAVEMTIPGDRVKVTLIRDGQLIDVRLIVGLEGQ
jgi:S1-C subfamily serine protease